MFFWVPFSIQLLQVVEGNVLAESLHTTTWICCFPLQSITLAAQSPERTNKTWWWASLMGIMKAAENVSCRRRHCRVGGLSSEWRWKWTCRSLAKTRSSERNQGKVGLSRLVEENELFLFEINGKILIDFQDQEAIYYVLGFCSC